MRVRSIAVITVIGGVAAVGPVDAQGAPARTEAKGIRVADGTPETVDGLPVLNRLRAELEAAALRVDVGPPPSDDGSWLLPPSIDLAIVVGSTETGWAATLWSRPPGGSGLVRGEVLEVGFGNDELEVLFLRILETVRPLATVEARPPPPASESPWVVALAGAGWVASEGPTTMLLGSLGLLRNLGSKDPSRWRLLVEVGLGASPSIIETTTPVFAGETSLFELRVRTGLLIRWLRSKRWSSWVGATVGASMLLARARAVEGGPEPGEDVAARATLGAESRWSLRLSERWSLQAWLGLGTAVPHVRVEPFRVEASNLGAISGELGLGVALRL